MRKATMAVLIAFLAGAAIGGASTTAKAAINPVTETSFSQKETGSEAVTTKRRYTQIAANGYNARNRAKSNRRRRGSLLKRRKGRDIVNRKYRVRFSKSRRHGGKKRPRK